MKGGKKKPSTEAVRPHLPPLFDQTASVNGDDYVAGVTEKQRDETERFEVTEETFEDENDGDEDEDSETEKDYDQFENLQIEEPGTGAEAERSKLADGYYEIEAVRRKRVRKGQVQYLIKWRGWPEAENTWEPVKNLLQCKDVIDTFEERYPHCACGYFNDPHSDVAMPCQRIATLTAGKSRSTRGRKRKHGITHAQMKKKQHRHSVASTEDSISMDYTHPNDLNVMNGKEKTNANGMTIGVKMSSDMSGERNVQNELDLKLRELKESIMANEENVNKYAIQSSQEGLVIPASHEGLIANVLPKSDVVDPVQSGRCTGAKKRKSFLVKRVKQDSALCVANDTQNAISPCSFSDHIDFHPHAFMGNDRDCKYRFDNSREMCNITQILRPMSYSSSSTSSNGEEVSITFEALRSDGTRVTVDNKFLKAHNPVLLINFYEKHLRYSPT